VCKPVLGTTNHVMLYTQLQTFRCIVSIAPDPRKYSVSMRVGVREKKRSEFKYWSNWFWYAFPPFALIAKALRKIKEEQCTGIMVVPAWEHNHGTRRLQKC
ncbi:unnamed protein product, partial [Trichogramma brassicae]